MIRIEKESDSGYLLKGGLLGFTNGLNVDCEGREESRFYLHPTITLLKDLISVLITLLKYFLYVLIIVCWLLLQRKLHEGRTLLSIAASPVHTV